MALLAVVVFGGLGYWVTVRDQTPPESGIQTLQPAPAMETRPATMKPAAAPEAATAPSVPAHGLSRDGIAELQILLMELGFDSGKVDGVFGARSARALTSWQLELSRDVDGKPSRQLLDELRAAAEAKRGPRKGM